MLWNVNFTDGVLSRITPEGAKLKVCNTRKFICVLKSVTLYSLFAKKKGQRYVKTKCTPTSENIFAFYAKILKTCFFYTNFTGVGVLVSAQYQTPEIPKPALYWKSNGFRSEKTPTKGAKVTAQLLRKHTKTFGWPTLQYCQK
jgi:hypothetical protein